MSEVSLAKVAMALGGSLLVAGIAGFVLARLAEGRGGRGLFRTFFCVLACVYALGFAARYVLVEVLP